MSDRDELSRMKQWIVSYYLEAPETSWGSPRQERVEAETRDDAMRITQERIRERHGLAQRISIRRVESGEQVQPVYRALTDEELATLVCKRAGGDWDALIPWQRLFVVRLVHLTREAERYERMPQDADATYAEVIPDQPGPFDSERAK